MQAHWGQRSGPVVGWQQLSRCDRCGFHRLAAEGLDDPSLSLLMAAELDYVAIGEGLLDVEGIVGTYLGLLAFGFEQN